MPIPIPRDSPEFSSHHYVIIFVNAMSYCIQHVSYNLNPQTKQNETQKAMPLDPTPMLHVQFTPYKHIQTRSIFTLATRMVSLYSHVLGLGFWTLLKTFCISTWILLFNLFRLSDLNKVHIQFIRKFLIDLFKSTLLHDCSRGDESDTIIHTMRIFSFGSINRTSW
mgnify:FL=1